MASDILGIGPANFSSGTEELIAVWKTAPMIRKSSSWVKAPIHLTNNTKAEMDMFLDHLFLTNGVDNLYAYDGTYWHTHGAANNTNVDRAPKAYFIKTHGTRVYLYDIKISDSNTRYNSRVAYSDLPKNDKITWGFEWGSDLIQTADDATVTSATAKFKTRNIKVGDPFFITAGTNTGEYVVSSITSETELELTQNLDNTVTGAYWVGGNWFDVRTDDGDFGNGLGETSNELIVFKKNTVHRVSIVSDTPETTRQINNVPGTTSSRSIISTGDYVYWFHPSGIYRTTGAESKMISNGIEDVIASVSIPSTVVGWENQLDNTINFYLGSVTTRDGETISYCVATFDENSEVWSLRSYDKTIKCATNWLVSNAPKVYFGDDSDGVYQIDTSYTFNGSKINFQLETQAIFPAGSEATVNFNRVRAYIDNGPDVQIMYKLLYKPLGTTDWVNDVGWQPLIGRQGGEKSDWKFPMRSRASGVKLRFVESSGDESFLLEKFVIYYSSESNY